jgi:hypothetical protein
MESSSPQVVKKEVMMILRLGVAEHPKMEGRGALVLALARCLLLFSATSIALTKHEFACSFCPILDFVYWLVIPLQTW